MSADNYVVVRKFGKNDFRWAMFFASDDEFVNKDDKCFIHEGFKTPREAADDATEKVDVIEYGIEFEEGCLMREQKLQPWEGCGKEFNEYFNEHFSKWYLFPIRGIIRKYAAGIWDAAILTHISKNWKEE
jgi:hypothetical protein